MSLVCSCSVILVLQHTVQWPIGWCQYDFISSELTQPRTCNHCHKRLTTKCKHGLTHYSDILQVSQHKQLLSLTSFSRCSARPPRLRRVKKNVLNRVEERLNALLVKHHSHRSTFVKGNSQVALQCTPIEKGYRQDLPPTNINILFFCRNNTIHFFSKLLLHNQNKLPSPLTRSHMYSAHLVVGIGGCDNKLVTAFMSILAMKILQFPGIM